MSETENQTPSDSPQTTLGDYIRRAREAQNIELSQLARENRMTDAFMQAIEEGNYSILPGDTYTRAYLRSVAARLGLDDEKILQWYLKETHQTKANELGNVIKIQNSEDFDKPTLHKGKLVLLILVSIGLLIASQIFRVMTEDTSESMNSTELNLALDSNQTKSVPDSNQTQVITASDSNSASDSTSVQPTTAEALIKQDSTRADSLAKHKDSIAQLDSSATQPIPQPVQKKVKTLLQISAIKDSTWISIKSKGFKDYARMIRKGQKPKYLSRTDTIILEVGDPELVKLQLNAQLTKITENTHLIYQGKLLP